MDAAEEKAYVKKLAKQARAARRFPTNTCPASRHVHRMADALAKGKLYCMFTEEPLHAAGSLYSVLASLWEARTKLEELGVEWSPMTEEEASAAVKAAFEAKEARSQ